MGLSLMGKRMIRSLSSPSSSRLIILFLTLLLGLWIGSNLSCIQSDVPNTEPNPLPKPEPTEEQEIQFKEEPIVVKESVSLVVIILTAVTHREKRDACRTTWIQLSAGRPVRHLFAIGGRDLTSIEMSELMTEHKETNDLLILKEVADNYSGLTQKLLSSIIHVSQNFDFKFLLKVDDDSFVLMDALMDELSNLQPRRLYWGYFNAGAPVKKTGAWKEKSWFLCDKYLPYAVGGGYVLSQDLVQFIATSSSLLQLYNSEDVSLGTWLSPLKITRKHDVRFDTWYKSRGCSNSFLVTHKQTPGLMKDKFQALETFGTLCKKERFVAAYLYDWSVLPSHCCLKRETMSE